MSAAWKPTRQRGEWLVVRAFAAMVPRLPRRFCHRLADWLGAAAALLDRTGRRVALENLQCAFGAEFSAERRSELVRESYQHFARAMADLFWSARLTPSEFEEIFEVAGLEQIRRDHGPEQGMIFAGLHYGGFEWIALGLGRSGFKCTFITQAFKNPLLDEPFVRLREVSGHPSIRRDRALLRLYKALLQGRSAAFTVDLTISAKLPSVPITCFGMQTCVTFAHAWLHERTGAPIVPVHCEPLPGGRYRLVFHPELKIEPGATHQEIAQACWDRFEPMIQRDPAPWLWMYKHWRYRPAQAARPYPAYANVSPHFQKLLVRTEKTRAAAAPAA